MTETHAPITEEIHKLLQQISAPYPAHGSGWVSTLRPDAAQFLADALLGEAERVRREDIHAICNRCKGGETPERIEKGGYIENFDAVQRGDWIHRETLDYDCAYCEAGAIHEAIRALAERKGQS